MPAREKRKKCGASTSRGMCGCKVEALISVDERGQMVLPKELREKAKIHAGDKLAVIGWEENDRVCCISLVKAENLTEMLKDLLGPMAKEIIGK